MTSSCDGLDGYSFGLVNVQEIDNHDRNKTHSETATNILHNFESYGGEDQFTLSPDSGIFSIYDDPVNDSAVQTSGGGAVAKVTSNSNLTLLQNTLLPRFFEDKFITDSEPPEPEIRMRRSVVFSNRLGTRFDFDISRVVRMLELEEIAAIFGQGVAVSLEQTDTSFVAFQTTNTIINRGLPLMRNSGLVSIKIRNMLNTGIDSVAIIPFRTGKEIELGPCFGVDLFDLAPHRLFRQLKQAVIIRANSKHNCQIGISRNRATPFLGSVDFRNGNLTLAAFNLPANAWDYDYLSNAFFEMEVEASGELESGSGIDFVRTRNNNVYLKNNDLIRQDIERLKPQYNLNNNKNNNNKNKSNNQKTDADPSYANKTNGLRQNQNQYQNQEQNQYQYCNFDSLYSGEVVRVYNQGIADAEDGSIFRYCEFDVFSAARELLRGESLSHQQHTLHINADNQTLAFIAQEVLGVNYEQTYEKMLR
jgi:hypothetical protein